MKTKTESVSKTERARSSTMIDVQCPFCKGHLEPTKDKWTVAACKTCDKSFSPYDLILPWIEKGVIKADYLNAIFRDILGDIKKNITEKEGSLTTEQSKALEEKIAPYCKHLGGQKVA